MAKSSKKSKEAVPDKESTAPGNTASSDPPPIKPAKSAARKTRTAKPAKAEDRSKSAGKSAGKAPVARKSRGRLAAPETNRVQPISISDEDIRLRAYFISEQRRQNGIAGDSEDDWLEARRRLREEAGLNA